MSICRDRATAGRAQTPRITCRSPRPRRRSRRTRRARRRRSRVPSVGPASGSAERTFAPTWSASRWSSVKRADNEKGTDLRESAVERHERGVAGAPRHRGPGAGLRGSWPTRCRPTAACWRSSQNPASTSGPATRPAWWCRVGDRTDGHRPGGRRGARPPRRVTLDGPAAHARLGGGRGREPGPGHRRPPGAPQPVGRGLRQLLGRRLDGTAISYSHEPAHSSEPLLCCPTLPPGAQADPTGATISTTGPPSGTSDPARACERPAAEPSGEANGASSSGTQQVPATSVCTRPHRLATTRTPWQAGVGASPRRPSSPRMRTNGPTSSARAPRQWAPERYFGTEVET